MTTSNNPIIQTLCIIGTGLIGGSFARALRKSNAVEHIIGAGRDEGRLLEAKKLGVIDSFELDLASAVKKSDVVLISVPLGAMKSVMSQIKAAVTDKTIITDAGSAKQSVIANMQEVFGHLPENFVPGHPIAGTEKSGVAASFAELYEKRKVILTPTATSNAKSVDIVSELWRRCGADVVCMDAQHHDEILAATSHLPHMLAYALVDCLANLDDKKEVFTYAAGGFRDFTRIASSDPEMWQDICVANKKDLVAIIDKFSDELGKLRDAVNNEDSEYMKALFSRAKKARDTFCG